MNELLLLELEEDARLAGVLQAQRHHAHLHLGTDVHAVVLKEATDTPCGSFLSSHNFVIA